MFVQMGMPKAIARQNNLSFTKYIQHQSPMWMGFADQQVNGAGPAAICTFAGNSAAHLTTAAAGNYFDNGAIQHLSHVILDMLQFFDMKTSSSKPGTDGGIHRAVQYMFHAPAIAPGNPNQYHGRGRPGAAAQPGPRPALRGANRAGHRHARRERRMGHLSCLQRSSRAADGTPMHIRTDGPGFDLDVARRRRLPKLQFSIFVPTAEFFRTMRRNQASLDLPTTRASSRRTTGWSDSSPRPGGRTSWCRPAGIGPSRSSSRPDCFSGPGSVRRRAGLPGRSGRRRRRAARGRARRA